MNALIGGATISTSGINARIEESRVGGKTNEDINDASKWSVKAYVGTLAYTVNIYAQCTSLTFLPPAAGTVQ